MTRSTPPGVRLVPAQRFVQMRLEVLKNSVQVARRKEVRLHNGTMLARVTRADDSGFVLITGTGEVFTVSARRRTVRQSGVATSGKQSVDSGICLWQNYAEDDERRSGWD